MRTWIAVATALFVGGSAGAAGGTKTSSPKQPSEVHRQAGTMHSTLTDAASVDTELSDWPEASRKAAKKMIEKYGAPAEQTASLLLWNETGPWKRSIVYKEEVPHDFPMPHTDVLEQFVDMKVPTDKVDELAKYDGSVIVERTKGEISARCDKEEANLLAINLAKEIIDGKKTVDTARTSYHDAIMKMMAGTPPPIMQKLQFTVAKNTADRDKSLHDVKKVRGEEEETDTKEEKRQPDDSGKTPYKK